MRPNMIKINALVMASLIMTACTDIYPRTTRPNYAIHVIDVNGRPQAVPPDCPSWQTDVTNPYDNQPLPQFGCATARNLALMVDHPQDLITSRTLGPANGTVMAGSVYRYTNNQTRGLIWTGADPNAIATTTAPNAASTITGEASGMSASSTSAAATGQ